jgi:hypothetical protein
VPTFYPVKFLWHTESAKRRRPPVPNIRITEADFLVGKKNGNPAFESMSISETLGHKSPV